MSIVDSFARTRRRRAFLMCQLALLSICAASPDYGRSQSTAAKAAAADKNPDGSSALGFSIESEMLTYRALESNSEAVACNIAAYLNGGSADFTNPPPGAVCMVNAGANSKAGVVIVPFDGSAFSDFHRWRADMETMQELRNRAATYCPTSTVLHVTERGAGAVPALPFAPAGSALSMAQTALGMISTEASASPVGGTITDQAFMDGVAGQLRSLSVPVLMPTTYDPYSLTTMDASRSPFLSSLDKLLQAHVCLEGKEAKSDAKDSIAKLIADMDAYLATLSGSAGAKTAMPAATPAPGGTTPAAAAAPSPSPLMTVLSADGLAQKLGVDPATGLLPDNGASQHILLLKALESGGAIEKDANIISTKIRYSGGSVGTYALFTMDGELECSGNVYDYGGSIPAKKFQKDLRLFNPDPSKQFIFQRGGCRVPVKH